MDDQKQQTREEDLMLGYEVMEKGDDVRPHSDYFPSRVAFLFASMGVALGYGNVWRFPNSMYAYGGAAFLIPYCICSALITIPVGFQEMALSSLTQFGVLPGFYFLHPRATMAGISWITMFCMLQYYPLLIAWTSIYVVSSVDSPVPWIATEEEHNTCTSLSNDDLLCNATSPCIYQENGDCVASDFEKSRLFFLESCNVNPDYHEGITNFSGRLAMSQFTLWALTFVSLFTGAKSLGYLSYVTVTVPVAIMLCLAIVGCFLPGAGDGLRAYFWSFDTSVWDTNVWSTALASSLFSTGVAQGCFAGCASHLKNRHSNFVQNTWIVVTADLAFSLLSGIAVFAMAGYLAERSGMELEELELGGAALLFQTYPLALSHLGSPWTQLLSFSFFLALWLLGFTTIVGSFEALVSSVPTKWKIPRWVIVAILCGFFALVGMLYCTDQAIHIHTSFDYFNTSVGMIFFCFAHATAAGWIQGNETNRKEIGPKSWWILLGTCFISGTIFWTIFLLAVSGFQRVLAFAFGTAVAFVGLLASWLTATRTDSQGFKYSYKTLCRLVFFGSVEEYRHALVDTFFPNGHCLPSPVWSFLVRYLIPLATLGMWLSFWFPNKPFAIPSEEDPYPFWIILFGCFLPFLGIVLAIVGLFRPETFEFLLPALENRPKLRMTPRVAQVATAGTFAQTFVASDATVVSSMQQDENETAALEQ